jgi:ketosteroid isomerase-like protein
VDPVLEDRIRRGYAAFVAGDLDATMEYFAPDVAYVNPEYALDAGTREGLAGMRRGLETLHDQFAFESIDIEEIVEGDDVAVHMVHVRAEGRHSGVPLHQTFAHVWRGVDEQAVSFEWFLTREEALAAAGLTDG